MKPLVAHADWSMHAKKRWMAVAVPSGSGWDVTMEPVDKLPALLSGLQGRAQGAPVALGLDLPIGLPSAYAERYGGKASDFPTFLQGLEEDSQFFKVCHTLAEVGPTRPFYPYNAQNGPKQAGHAKQLGMDFKKFRRWCDKRTNCRPDASPLFWTLGAKQVGKGALTAWQHLLRPALAGPNPPALWPFEGGFLELLAAGRTVIAETYPAEAMCQLEVKMNGSKTKQRDRANLAPALLGKMSDVSAEPDEKLVGLVTDGFGPYKDGEDPFDALLGLLGMLRVVQCPQLDTVPDTPAVRRWEGWILGQALPDASSDIS